MKSRLILLCLTGLLMSGCTSLKDQQLGAYVGDTKTKIFYKNVGPAAAKIPSDRKQYFRGVDDATAAGYTSSTEAIPGEKGDKSDDSSGG